MASDTRKTWVYEKKQNIELSECVGLDQSTTNSCE